MLGERAGDSERGGATRKYFVQDWLPNRMGEFSRLQRAGPDHAKGVATVKRHLWAFSARNAAVWKRLGRDRRFSVLPGERA